MLLTSSLTCRSSLGESESVRVMTQNGENTNRSGNIRGWHRACHPGSPSALRSENVKATSLQNAWIRTRKAAEDFAAWPRGVNEEANVDIRNQQTEQLGNEEKVVVMNPNEVSRTINDHYSTRESGIGLFIRRPMLIRRKGRG